MRLRKIRRVILGILTSVLLFLLLLEGMLRWLDPQGVYALGYNSDTHASLALPSPRGYVMQPGQHPFIGWAANITTEHNRVVPATNRRANCRLVMLGDSVTFGQGVEDRETFSNLLAEELPQVEVINTANNGYNIQNVLATLTNTDGDAYVYTMIRNDQQQPLTYAGLYRDGTRSAVSYYRQWLFGSVSVSFDLIAEDDFWKTAEAIFSHDNLLVFGFQEDELARKVQARYPRVILLERYTSHVSPVDGHPDAIGHAQIADQMIPHVRDFLPNHCPL